MDITVEAIEALRVPDGFTPVVGFRRFGIPWPPREPEHYLVQKGPPLDAAGADRG
jgi:hypothetical protein